MTEPVRVCVVGSANVDLIFRTSRFPRPGETLRGLDWQQNFGGKGANQAVIAARLGGQVCFVGRVGEDDFGRQTQAHFQREGINHAHLRSDAQLLTGLANIMVDQSAENCILLIPGANAALSAADVQQASSSIASGDVVLAQLEVPVEAVSEAFELAKKFGIKTILNPAPAPQEGASLPKDLWPLCDCCIPNELELAMLTGSSAEQIRTSEEVLLSAARELLGLGVARVVVTRGSRPALLVERQRTLRIPSQAATAVDTTGAGDAFVGSFGVFWGAGMDISEALARATRVAALTVTRRGTQSSYPSASEARGFWA